MGNGKNLIVDLSFEFSLSIIDFYKKLTREKEFVLSKQILRSGTSIGWDCLIKANLTKLDVKSLLEKSEELKN